MRRKVFFDVFKETWVRWFDSRAFELGAALAYYAVFSIAPILVIAIAMAGFLFGEEAARGQVVARLNETIGPTVAPAIEGLIYQAHSGGSSWLATLLGVAVLLFGAIGLFNQLQSSLNDIWGVRPKPDRGILAVVSDRALSFVIVLVIAVLLLASVVMSTILTTMSELVADFPLPGGYLIWRLANWVVSLALLTLLFAVIFKVLPDARIAWSDVWIGGAVTAVLFTLGSYLIGLYVGRQSVTSAYGAAGSLVIVLLWVNYSSQTVLIGAAFTRILAERRGRPLQPTSNAMLSPN